MEIRLANFIRANIEPILTAWEEYTQRILHGEHIDGIGLREHAGEMLIEIANDLDSTQTDAGQMAKSRGEGAVEEDGSWAEVRASDSHASGFSVMETVSEFRALRASVVSLWTRACPMLSGPHIDDLARFNEAIDEAAAEFIEHYAILKEMETRLFGSIMMAEPNPIFVMDLDGRFTHANRATADLIALEPDAITGRSTSDLGFPFAVELQRNLNTVITGKPSCRGEIVHAFAQDRHIRFEYLISPVLNEQRKTEAAVCILRDVTERAIAEEKIWHNAHHDLLTGLPNRRLFMDRLEQEIKQAKRSSLSFSVLFMDLDGFKEVNDLLGHDAGDRLLCDVAERLKDCVREADTVARLGGDEFTVLLTGAQQHKDVALVAQTIIEILAMPFRINRRTVEISVSLGLSRYPQDASTPRGLLQAADKAMYKAKRKSGSKRALA